MASEQIYFKELLCVLSFGEMAIVKNSSCKSDFNNGFYCNNESRVAYSAIVFMLAGVEKKWKQPIAFYFVKETETDGRLLSTIIKEILEECFKTGLTVVATVCDLSAVNLEAIELLGSTEDKPYFDIGGHEIVTILDPPDLLMCTRNVFMSHDIEIRVRPSEHVGYAWSSGLAKWSHLQQFYDIDKKHPTFTFARVLTDQHLRPNAKQKMAVYMAAQIFSHDVTGGFLSRIATKALPNEARATATLLNHFDQLFDALNADTPDRRQGKMYSTIIRRKTPHLEYFKEMREFISAMKFVGLTSPPPLQSGWIRTMNAVERLWNNLRAMRVGVRKLFTRRLNVDALENLFFCISFHCGSRKPTIAQFVDGMKISIINNLEHSGYFKDRYDDGGSLHDNFRHFLSVKTQPVHEEIVDPASDYLR